MQTGILSLLLSLCMLFSSTGGIKKTNLSSSELKSYTTQGELTIELNADIDEETKENMKPFNLQSVFNALSDFKMVWGGNVILDKINYESIATSAIEAPDMKFTAKSYQKLTDDELTIISELPTISRFALPEKYENAKYVSMSLNESDSTPSLNTQKLYEMTNKLFTSMAQEDSLIYKFAEENKEIFSYKSGVYTISFENENFEEFVKALVFEFCENENSVEYIKALANYISPLLSAMYPDNEEFNEVISFFQMADTLDKTHLDYLKESAETIFEDIEGVDLFGEKGLVIKVDTTDKGYIENINAQIDLSFNLTEMFSYADEEENQKFIIDAFIVYNNDFSNFNKIEKIEKPEITNENTVSYKNWLSELLPEEEALYPEYESGYYEDEYEDNWYEKYYGENPQYYYDIALPMADGSIPYFINDTLVDFGEHKPIVVNGVDYVELTSIDKILSWGDNYIYSWNNDTKTMFVDNGWGKTYSFKINTDIINFGPYSIKLTDPIIDVYGVCYVPLKTYISAIHNYECRWDNELRSIFIY